MATLTVNLFDENNNTISSIYQGDTIIVKLTLSSPTFHESYFDLYVLLGKSQKPTSSSVPIISKNQFISGQTFYYVIDDIWLLKTITATAGETFTIYVQSFNGPTKYAAGYKNITVKPNSYATQSSIAYLQCCPPTNMKVLFYGYNGRLVYDVLQLTDPDTCISTLTKNIYYKDGNIVTAETTDSVSIDVSIYGKVKMYWQAVTYPQYYHSMSKITQYVIQCNPWDDIEGNWSSTDGLYVWYDYVTIDANTLNNLYYDNETGYYFATYESNDGTLNKITYRFRVMAKSGTPYNHLEVSNYREFHVDFKAILPYNVSQEWPTTYSCKDEIYTLNNESNFTFDLIDDYSQFDTLDFYPQWSGIQLSRIEYLSRSSSFSVANSYKLGVYDGAFGYDLYYKLLKTYLPEIQMTDTIYLYLYIGFYDTLNGKFIGATSDVQKLIIPYQHYNIRINDNKNILINEDDGQPYVLLSSGIAYNLSLDILEGNETLQTKYGAARYVIVIYDEEGNRVSPSAGYYQLGNDDCSTYETYDDGKQYGRTIDILFSNTNDQADLVFNTLYKFQIIRMYSSDLKISSQPNYFSNLYFKIMLPILTSTTFAGKLITNLDSSISVTNIQPEFNYFPSLDIIAYDYTNYSNCLRYKYYFDWYISTKSSYDLTAKLIYSKLGQDDDGTAATASCTFNLSDFNCLNIESNSTIYFYVSPYFYVVGDFDSLSLLIAIKTTDDELTREVGKPNFPILVGITYEYNKQDISPVAATNLNISPTTGIVGLNIVYLNWTVNNPPTGQTYNVVINNSVLSTNYTTTNIALAASTFSTTGTYNIKILSVYNNKSILSSLYVTYIASSSSSLGGGDSGGGTTGGDDSGTSTITNIGNVYYYTDENEWQYCQIYRYDGNSWTPCAIQYYNGSSWIKI